MSRSFSDKDDAVETIVDALSFLIYRALQELLHSYALLSIATLGDPYLDATLIELEWEWAKSGDGFGVWW